MTIQRIVELLVNRFAEFYAVQEIWKKYIVC